MDILIPLDSLSPEVWNSNFQGEIRYLPIDDFYVLPKEIAVKEAHKIIEDIKTKKVAIFCLGGHGRTGYLASIILGLMEYKDPIKFIRDNYCISAVESLSQIEQIGEILEKDFSKYYTFNDLFFFNVFETNNVQWTKDTCGECRDYIFATEECKKTGKKVKYFSPPCDDFINYRR